jgi:hypothetical protein
MASRSHTSAAGNIIQEVLRKPTRQAQHLELLMYQHTAPAQSGPVILYDVVPHCR